jgi:hypothetical protein
LSDVNTREFEDLHQEYVRWRGRTKIHDPEVSAAIADRESALTAIKAIDGEIEKIEAQLESEGQAVAASLNKRNREDYDALVARAKRVLLPFCDDEADAYEYAIQLPACRTAFGKCRPFHLLSSELTGRISSLQALL